jgi:hypothetical protein
MKGDIPPTALLLPVGHDDEAALLKDGPVEAEAFQAYPRRWWILFLLSVTSMHQARVQGFFEVGCESNVEAGFAWGDTPTDPSTAPPPHPCSPAGVVCAKGTREGALP